MHLGAAWYPEHWPEARWRGDLRLMREAGFTVTRIAEFAWSMMEPTEGNYQFDWLERAIDLLHENGLAIVLGTPTAAPPAWLTHNHPETLAIEPTGRMAQHGNRCHYSPTSALYREYARRIVEEMARRYGQDARVIGWQIDNEYNRVDYSENSRRQFQAFLKAQYGTLEALNAHLSAAYWSQTYTAWDEIPLPIGPHNPGLLLAFNRFVTHVWRDYQKLQIDTIRRYSRPEQWITHNFMGWFDVFDHYEVSADLDFVSWDWYIGSGHNDYTRSGAVHDLTRGLKRRNFWLMETQPGCVNWADINNRLTRGEARCMAWHAIAHGADAVLYWQWRSAPGGQEQVHGALLGADGAPRPFYQETQELGLDFQALGTALDDTTLQNEVAILHSYDARWAINWQRHHKDFDPKEHLLRYYVPLAEKSVGVDVVSAEASLEGYRLVIAPALIILSETTARNLTAFVERGGVLVLTTRTGQKDVHNALFPALQPGPLRELMGMEVEEYYALDELVPVHAAWRGEEGGHSAIWAESLRPLGETTQILARFGDSNGWLDGAAALTRRPVGENGGQAIYVGAVLDDTLQRSLIAWLLEQAQVTPTFAEAPPGVEVARRVAKDGRSIFLVLNHTRQPQTLPLTSLLPAPARDLLTGAEFDSAAPLPPYAVRVFETSP